MNNVSICNQDEPAHRTDGCDLHIDVVLDQRACSMLREYGKRLHALLLLTSHQSHTLSCMVIVAQAVALVGRWDGIGGGPRLPIRPRPGPILTTSDHLLSPNIRFLYVLAFSPKSFKKKLKKF